MATEETGAQVRTFLIADLRGYTRYTSEQGDEAAARLATRFAELADAVASAREGAVIELRGDEALAVFASARQGIRAALELQARLSSEVAYDPTLPLLAGVGLDVGEAVPVKGGYRGGALNLAARLCNHAGPGEILASDATIHLARKIPGVMYRELGLIQLKGLSDPVSAFQVMSEGEKYAVPERRMLDSTRGITSTSPERLPLGGFLGAVPEHVLVGRQHELVKLQRELKRVTDGDGRLVLLSGEPGIGKTRLAQELTILARDAGFLVAAGRCHEQDLRTLYRPFIDIIYGFLASCPTDIREEIPRRWPYLSRLVPDAGLPSPPVDGKSESGEDRFFRSVSGFLGALAQSQPVALLLDDLHWADESSLRLLRHLTQSNRSDRVLLVGTYRDEELVRHHALEDVLRDLGRERVVERIPIRRLNEMESAALLAVVLGQLDVPEEIVKGIVRRTDGNPFFIEEMARELQDRGLIQTDASAELPGIDNLEIPSTIRSLIGHRISRLPSSVVEILSEASVVGPRFSFDDLQAATGKSELEIEDALEEARAGGIILTSGKDRFYFQHSLVQETLYAITPPRRRRRLHRAVGEAIERLPKRKRERRVAEIAHHFLASDDELRALEYCVLAADAAAARRDYGEAEKQYRIALRLAEESCDTLREAEVLDKLASVFSWQALHPAALEALERAASLYSSAMDLESETSIRTRIGQVHLFIGSISQGLSQIDAMLAKLANVECSTSISLLHSVRARLLEADERYNEMQQAADTSLQVAETCGDRDSAMLALTLIGVAHLRVGAISNARKLFEDVVTQGNCSSAATAPRLVTILAGELCMIQGDFERAREHWERSLQISEGLQRLADVAFDLSNLAELCLFTGAWEEGRSYALRAAVLSSALEVRWSSGYGLLQLGALELARGDLDAARGFLSHGQELAKQSEDRQGLRTAARGLAEVDLLAGNPDAAIRRLLPFLHGPDSSNETVTRLMPLAARTHLARGDTVRTEAVLREGSRRAVAQSHQLALVGLVWVKTLMMTQLRRFEEARVSGEETVELARSMPFPLMEARGHAALGVLHELSGKPVVAEKHHITADRLFRRLGARTDVRLTA